VDFEGLEFHKAMDATNILIAWFSLQHLRGLGALFGFLTLSMQKTSISPLISFS
jgi:hypothetical protein